MKKNFITRAATLAAALLMVSSLLSGCTEKEAENVQIRDDAGNLIKPEKITMMATTIMTPENGLQLVCDKYKELTGIELIIEKPDHNQYYEKVNLSFAGGSPANVIELGSTYYPNYSNYGALWDMTDAWENSDLKKSGIVEEQYVDALKIDERLYGFPISKGGGTVTYVRKDWMDELGLSDPKNYEEFLDMLRAFKGRGENIIPITAAGLINTETPYDIYLREFYQDANPDFYYDEASGQYVDGMSQPAMKKALERMRDAYKEGLIDSEIVTNKTSTCRDKFYADLVGCFNYWAGTWNKTMEENLQTGVPNGTIKPLPPIAETEYIERAPTAMVITNATPNPEAVFKYLIEYSHDGGEGQMLFTHGIEDVHWKREADGSAVALPYLETPDKLVEKFYYGPELSFTKFDDPIKLDERIVNSLDVFYSSAKPAPVPKTSDVITNELPELDTIRKEVISKVVLGEVSVEDGVKEYEDRAAIQIKLILEDLNKTSGE